MIHALLYKEAAYAERRGLLVTVHGHGMTEAWNQSMKARRLDGDVFLPKFHLQDSREWSGYRAHIPLYLSHSLYIN